MSKLSITLINSVIGNKQDQRDTVRVLGLRKLHQTVIKDDNASIRGMVHKVRHLVRVEEISG
ncbi:MAG: 50S ribosomal protein L30 [Dehalococcoidia bacterium]|nr:50S ribosomal protein L30 [Dehalococcoidia bacterium]MQG16427.1 50S ribosomal protein L30 [SAR202 cluster bacterium]